ncbi:MAG: FG-GAP-like repeat-containing protein [Gammaproteobacteria bacterium]|nr:FG-GAP-like repeat-containing protein [Gammaproteobacteria bacterium]
MLAWALALTACAGGGGGGGKSALDQPPGTATTTVAAGGGNTQQPGPSPTGNTLNEDVRGVAATSLGLSGDPATSRGAARTLPDSDPLVKLGQLLFFSQTLSANYDVSCGSCHHPDFAGGDGLSLAVGVAAKNSAIVGPGREVDPAKDLDPLADSGPNVHRNTTTTFNAALFDRVLTFDGGIAVLDTATLPGGRGQLIQTPESRQRSDASPVSGLLEFSAKLPLNNNNEMRGFRYIEYGTADDYRSHVVRRLRGEVDAALNPNPDGPANWLAKFRLAFAMPEAAAKEIITMPNMQRALGAYMSSQIFVENPWRRFLNGQNSAISDDAKRGALLFLRNPEDGGVGCTRCHAGDRFTDEKFHNAGFPQLGRGFVRADRSDLGRWLETLAESDRHAFRTPSLLNVAETAPYGHAGSFATLESAVAYHADPRAAVNSFDFRLLHLEQFRRLGMEYDHAEPHTRAAIAASSFAASEAILPARTLAGDEIDQLTAFLKTLSDGCVTDEDCIDAWTPSADDDPDGHQFVRGRSPAAPIHFNPSGPEDYPREIRLAFPSTRPLATFADVEDCGNGIASALNSGDLAFRRRNEPAFGLVDSHGYRLETWSSDLQHAEAAMIAGGVTATYLDGDCWADIIFAGGDEQTGVRTYRNMAGIGFQADAFLDGISEKSYTGAASIDLNGDYRRELLLGNLFTDAVPVLAQVQSGYYTPIANLPMTRPTYGISAAPLDTRGFPYFYLGHWSDVGTAGTAPALWKNDGAALYPWDAGAGTSSSTVDQRFNFTPAFADFTGDGLADLVIASDFETSVTLRNRGNPASGPRFIDETDRAVITDENGMGSALLDIDNDGNIEWFVTSIYDTGTPAGGWGATGNRLYRNASTARRIAFEDITNAAGVRDGLWGWGACAADFNNDGFTDIFHVNGFGYVPFTNDTQARYDKLTKDTFQAKPSRLFINDGDGTFTEMAREYRIADPSEGRGLACFDHDRDGDIDIVVLDHSTGLQFFENQSGSATGRAFLNIRLVGAAPNTDAIGARVTVTANVGPDFGTQTQLRLSQANSNFSSQNPPDLHFGLGHAAAATSVRVTWPGGTELVCADVAANQFIVLDQRLGHSACPPPR